MISIYLNQPKPHHHTQLTCSPTMKITTKSTLPLLPFTFLIINLSFSTNVASNSWVGSKYEVACTMCSACDNPCTTPTTYSPPPPSSPPPSSSAANYPPPQNSGTNNNYYYSPPPPSQSSYGNSPPGNTGVYLAPPDKYYVRPPPPNPIVPYFPFYYHSPPPPSSAHISRNSIVVNFVLVTHILVLCFC